MPYFDRLRQLAAAGASPRRGPSWVAGLEVDKIRVAPPPVRRDGAVAAAPHTRAESPAPAAGETGVVPAAPVAADSGPMPANVRAVETTEVVVAATDAAPPRRPPHTQHPAVSPAAAGPKSRPRPPEPARQHAAEPAREHAAEPTRARAAEPARERAANRVPVRDGALLADAAREAAAGPPATAAPATPAERVHQALAEVRQWMEQPAVASDPADRPAPAAAPARAPTPEASSATITEARTELSIGTIEVTVEETPAPTAPRARPAAPAPRPPVRDIVPRDYLRGW